MTLVVYVAKLTSTDNCSIHGYFCNSAFYTVTIQPIVRDPQKLFRVSLIYKTHWLCSYHFWSAHPPVDMPRAVKINFLRASI